MSVAAPSPPLTPPLLGVGGWTTPKLLQASLGAIWVAAFLLFLAVLLGTRQHYDAVKTVGQDAAPSIVAAERIKAALADMDANVANELIARPGQNQASALGYENRRAELGRSLVGAAENITYGDSEREPIRTMNYELGTYEAKVAEARLLHERGGDVSTLTRYRQANDVMRLKLLPAADALDKTNDQVLERVYARQKATSGVTLTLVWVGDLLLLAALVATQILLARRTRRVLNLALLGATALALLFLGYASSHLAAATEDLRAAKQDSFDSVYALWHARAVAFDANADESRWLIDRAHASGYEADFLAKSGRIATLPPGTTYDAVAAACQNGQVKTLSAGFTGFLADELRNVTFTGEQDAADQTLSAWGRYVAIDGQIRALENQGRHADAVALCTGTGPDQSNGAYRAFDDALGRTLDINEKELAKDVNLGFADLSTLPLLAPIAALLIALLSWLGMRPRLREYGG